MAALGVSAGLYSLRHLARAWATGTVPGRLGAVHVAPEPLFWAGVVFGLIGLALGGACLLLAWRCWRPPAD